MTRFPSLTGRKLIAALKRAGFSVVRIKGSHHYLQHVDGRATVIPVHAGDDIGRGLLAKIFRGVDISEAVLKKHL